MNRTVNREVIRFTLASGWSLSLFSGEDFGIFVLALLFLASLLILHWSRCIELSVHSHSGICCLGHCLNDLVEFSHNFRVFSG